MSRGHIVLLGDSVFDNASYVSPGAATADALRSRLADGWEVTLLAEDGSTIDEIGRQLLHLPSAATHIVLCTGGNDALAEAGILTERAGTVAEALWKLGHVVGRFERRYSEMLRKVRARTLPIVVCAIYNGNFSDAHLQAIAATALAVFNDAIGRVARRARIPVIDLRAICDEPEDYVNDIEPSARGSEKIAGAIATQLQV